MKKVAIALAVLVLGVAVAGGAIAWARSGDDKGGQEVKLTAADSGRTVEIDRDTLLTLTLDSNVTTGFQWELVAAPDESVVEPAGQEYVAPEDVEGEEPVMGAGGREVWTFKAVGPGETELRLEYSQPWEGGAEADKTFELTVVVR